ncbi:hypothetical protein [Sphingopyxis fribergensis]
MDYVKVLTGGLSAWLDFERACARSSMFDEKYLKGPVGQILSARTGLRVEAEYKHPVLAKSMSGPGRRPAVDFVVRDPDKKIVVAVETKWAGATVPSPADILWDIVRLELIASQENARCFFLLAGTRQKLESIFMHPQFSDAAGAVPRRPILRHDNNVRHMTPLVPVVASRNAMVKRMFTPYRDRVFAEKVISRRTAPVPLTCRPREYQVFGWEIVPAGTRREFTPVRSR